MKRHCQLHGKNNLALVELGLKGIKRKGNGVRLDKYLQVSRLIKSAPALEACLAGRVQINGKIAKAGSEVKEGDEITLAWGKRLTRVKVVQVPLRNVPSSPGENPLSTFGGKNRRNRGVKLLGVLGNGLRIQ